VNAQRARRARFGMAGTTLLTATIGAAVLGACSDQDGSGDLITVTMSDIVDPEMTALTVTSDIDVDVIVDATQPQSASLRIDDNLLDDIDIWIDDDGELFVGWDTYKAEVEPSEQPKLTIHVQRLDSVENRSEGTVTVAGVDEHDFSVTSVDDGAIKVQGRATSVDVDVADDGDVDLEGLVASAVDLKNTGDGSLSIQATQTVTGEVSGDGDVRVLGGPATDQVQRDGDGDLVTG